MHAKKQTYKNNKTSLSLKRVTKTKVNMKPSIDANTKNLIDVLRDPQKTCSPYLRALFKATSVGKKYKNNNNSS